MPGERVRPISRGPRSAVLVFLVELRWPAISDLYAWHADTKKLVRLTNLESDKDELNVSEEQRDDRTPSLSRSSARARRFRCLARRPPGHIRLQGRSVSCDDGRLNPLLRLTRTKANESSAGILARQYAARFHPGWTNHCSESLERTNLASERNRFRDHSTRSTGLPMERASFARSPKAACANCRFPTSPAV